jgi:hypothetical protein
MAMHAFTIIATGLNPSDADFEDRFFDAGCDDATISLQKGALILEFSREAKNFVHAVVSAVRDVLKAGATPERIEPDHLVSLADIAQRAGLSRAACSHFAKGDRGTNFPSPIVRVTTESPLWDWVAVSRWLYRRDKLVPLNAVVEAKVVRALNRCALDEALPNDMITTIIAAQSGLRERAETA